MLTFESRNNLHDIIRSLTELDKSFVQSDVSRHFITFDIDNSVARLSGNEEGLIHVAKAILQLVVKGIQGCHHHFDEAGMLDRSSIPLIVELTQTDETRKTK